MGSPGSDCLPGDVETRSEPLDIVSSVTHEVAIKVLSQCKDVRSLAAAEQTCRSWKELAADQQPWQAAYQNAFPLSSVSKQGLSCRPGHHCWKAAYRWKQQVERCWQQGDKRSVAVCEGHQGWVNAARFSASGVVVSGSADESVIIWGKDGTARYVMSRGHSAAVWAVDAGRTTAASAGMDGQVVVWDLGSGRATKQLSCRPAGQQWPRVWATGAQVLPCEQQVLSCVTSGCLVLWDLRSGRPGMQLHAAGRVGTRYSSQSDQRSRQGSESGSSSCYCAATSGHWLAAGTTAGAVLLYDLRMACKAAEAAGAHQGSTFSVALQGSRLASGGEDGVVLAWDVGRLAGADSRAVAEGVQRQREAQAGRRQHSGCVYSVRLGQEWQVASAGAEGRAVVWRWQEASGTSAGQEASGPSLQPVTTCRPSLDDDPSLAKAVADSEAGLDAPLAMEACAVHAVDLSETGLLAAGADSLVRVYSYEG